MVAPSSIGHEGHEHSEKAPVGSLGLSGFRKDAAIKNSFNPVRDFSLPCKTRDTVTLGMLDGRWSALAMHQHSCCCDHLAMRRRRRRRNACAQTRADRGHLAPAKQLFWKISNSIRSLQRLSYLLSATSLPKMC